MGKYIYRQNNLNVVARRDHLLYKHVWPGVSTAHKQDARPILQAAAHIRESTAGRAPHSQRPYCLSARRDAVEPSTLGPHLQDEGQVSQLPQLPLRRVVVIQEPIGRQRLGQLASRRLAHPQQRFELVPQAPPRRRYLRGATLSAMLTSGHAMGLRALEHAAQQQ